MKRYYVVGIVEKSHKVRVNISDSFHDLNLTWADGMTGVCAVFTNKKKARKYAGRSDVIIKTVKAEEN